MDSDNNFMKQGFALSLSKDQEVRTTKQLHFFVYCNTIKKDFYALLLLRQC